MKMSGGVNIAPVILNDLFTNSQAYTRTGIISLHMQPLKKIKDLRGKGRVETDAIITDGNLVIEF